jgi:hypothetical protein
MLKDVLPAIRALFAGAKPCRSPVNFSWRLVRRKKRPFLLLPETSGSASDSFQLYSAHRPLAKLWRSLIPLILRTPLARFLGKVAIAADTESDFMQFLAQQSGLPAAQLSSPAIKFGGVVGKTMRLVLLLRDAGGHPIRVVKVGLDPAGRAATEREAALLSNLPKDVIGCTGLTGRFSSATLSAFATAFFSGESLDTDLGIEKLFHDWLNDAPPEPIENLATWRELQSVAKGAGLPQWPMLRDALAGQMVRTTIYHGDFAPWNVRMTNLETIRAFDWERGHLKGIPAWDWFHFIVQTSILVKQYSPERVAAELEQLVLSPRFKQYASDAGISEIIEPLLLAYLLEQKLIVRPMEGSAQTERLFRLLWAKWQFKENAGRPAPAPAADMRMPAGEQIKFAFAKLANLFWEPSLSPVIRPPLTAQLLRYWPAWLASCIWIGGVATMQFSTDPHLTFAPFYLVPCVLLALKADRRLGFILASVAGAAGPLIKQLKQPMMIPLDVTCWNIVMRVFVFILMVVLLDNVRRQSFRDRPPHALHEQNAMQAISGNWAVVLITSIYFALVVVLDVLTNPYYLFLPLYLLPCVIFTLTLNWRWGTLAAVIASVVGPLTQRFEDPGYQLLGVEFWNTFMRLMIFQTVVLLLARIRRKNILFSGIKTV